MMCSHSCPCSARPPAPHPHRTHMSRLAPTVAALTTAQNHQARALTAGAAEAAAALALLAESARPALELALGIVPRGAPGCHCRRRRHGGAHRRAAASGGPTRQGRGAGALVRYEQQQYHGGGVDVAHKGRPGAIPNQRRGGGADCAREPGSDPSPPAGRTVR